MTPAIPIEKARESTLGALVADAYCLGPHWIYDEQQLISLKIDWHQLNPPQTPYHRGKKAGQYTHYGDQLLWFHEYVGLENGLSASGWAKYWQYAMNNYRGYLDGASRGTIENLQNGQTPPCGADSHDLSVAGRIAPLLCCARNRLEFMVLATRAAAVTHGGTACREATGFVADLLWRLAEGTPLDNAMDEAVKNAAPTIAEMAQKALTTISHDTPDAIRALGPSCDIAGALPGAIHVLMKWRDNYQEGMIENARAGGDSAARGMVAGAWMVCAFQLDVVPEPWLNGLREKPVIKH